MKKLLTMSIFLMLAIGSGWGQSMSDAEVAKDAVGGFVFENGTGFPTDATSYAIQAAEAAAYLSRSEALAGAAEALSGPLGAGAAAFSSSYTAGPGLDDFNYPVGTNDQIVLPPFDPTYRTWDLQHMTLPPNGPTISSGYSSGSRIAR